MKNLTGTVWTLIWNLLFGVVHTTIRCKGEVPSVIDYLYREKESFTSE